MAAAAALCMLPSTSPPTRGTQTTQPFRTAEEAWFWTMAALTARRDGARYTSNRVAFSGHASPTTW